jgi:dolichol-phosphate mannosyltransferase
MAFLPQVIAETEVILVNDGSSDRTLEALVQWATEDRRIKVIHLSRNFGHQIAATAGLDHATGEVAVLLDADLQDPLPVILRMIERYCEGYEVVYGQREKRKGESRFKLVSAWLFYRLMHRLLHKDMPLDTGDFRLISRQCLDSLKIMRETHRFLRGMGSWLGYPQCGVLYQREPRVSGATKYSLGRMLSFAWTAATSFSTVPLQASIVLGIITGLFAAEEACRAILASVLGWYAVPGWTSLMIVTTVIGSALLISVGIVGQYVGRIYEQSKSRPLYLVATTVNLGAEVGEPAHRVLTKAL